MKFKIVWDNLVTDDELSRIVNLKDLDAADDYAYSVSTRPGYSVGNYSIYVEVAGNYVDAYFLVDEDAKLSDLIERVDNHLEAVRKTMDNEECISVVNLCLALATEHVTALLDGYSDWIGFNNTMTRSIINTTATAKINLIRRGYYDRTRKTR